MSYGLLGAHVNTAVSGLADVLSTWKPPLVVVLDHAEVWHEFKQESPDTLMVGRLFLDSEPDFNDRNLDPVLAARAHCEAVLPWAERMADAYDYWQGVNEPVLHSHDALRRCAAFDAERARYMHDRGYRVVVGSFSVGNPRSLAFWRSYLTALEAALQFNGALALHEYDWPTLGNHDEWLLFRHRKVYEGAPEEDWEGLPEHLRALPLLITECGLDGLIEQTNPPRGWRTLHGDDPLPYLEELAWYDSELQKDEYVAGAAIYCLATPDAQWKSYDIWPELVGVLAQDATPLYRLAEPEPPEQPPLPEPPGPPQPGWHMEFEYRTGSRVLAGSFPRAGIELTVTDPGGNASQVVSGSKLDYGPGGFELLAPHMGVYELDFLDQSFQVHTHDGLTLVTFLADPGPPPLPTEQEGLMARAKEHLNRLVYLLRIKVYGSIGTAAMAPDESITLMLRLEWPDGIIRDTWYTFTPEQARYSEILSHVGGLAPGETKPVPPWRDPAYDQ